MIGVRAAAADAHRPPFPEDRSPALLALRLGGRGGQAAGRLDLADLSGQTQHRPWKAGKTTLQCCWIGWDRHSMTISSSLDRCRRPWLLDPYSRPRPPTPDLWFLCVRLLL
jgi:hypothetical protein